LICGSANPAFSFVYTTTNTTLAALSFGPRLRGYLPFYAHTTVSATEVSLLPVHS